MFAGATGFLGAALLKHLEGHDVVALVRHGQGVRGAKPVAWDGLHMDRWADEIDGADAVIDYAGAPITMKFTDENRKTILESRVMSTHLLGQAIDGAAEPPKVWINASATGFYGSRGAEILDETSPAGTDFLAGVCVAWEQALMAERLPNTRRVALRTGLPLSPKGGFLKPLLTLTKLFLGGRQGDGHQWQPWIHLDDHCAMVEWLLENDAVSGPVNAVGPAPCINETLMATLRRVVGRPPAPPAPTFVLDLVGKALGPDPEVVLASTRAIPKVAQDAGFKWKHPSLEAALRDLLKG